jgi:hypothetical protein
VGQSERRASVLDTPGAGVRAVVITTIATHNYLPRLAEIGTLDYLARNAGLSSVALGLVGCEPPDCPDDVRCYTIPSGMLDRSLGNPGNGCIQHGNWLPYLATDDDAVIICIDGDVKMQRPFSLDEWAWLQAWQDGQIGIGPNEPKQGGDNMINELCRIQPLVSDDEIGQKFHTSAADPIGNAGCVVATRSTWLKLWQAYLRRWLDTAPYFAHIAVQQWTLNLCINESFQRVVLPQSFSTHGHWGELGPPYAGWGVKETATLDGEPILFAHKTW